MAGSVITIAQQKGGAGKTTLAAHLAVAMAQSGRSVAIMDIDPQGSLTAWSQARGEAEPAIAAHQVTGWRAAGAVERLARDFDVVIVDSPPHAETEARIAVRAADLVLVPLQPSPMDFWATKPTIALAAAEKTAVLVVLNRVPARARLADEITDQMDELGADLAEARIGNRIALAAALMKGRGVTETHRRSMAAEEIDALAKEMLDRLR
ncbi:MAG: ParA family partition ATPase [Pseudomonadota bacterium]